MESGPGGIFWPKSATGCHLEHPEKVVFLTERVRFGATSVCDGVLFFIFFIYNLVQFNLKYMAVHYSKKRTTQLVWEKNRPIQLGWRRHSHWQQEGHHCHLDMRPWESSLSRWIWLRWWSTSWYLPSPTAHSWPSRSWWESSPQASVPLPRMINDILIFSYSDCCKRYLLHLMIIDHQM